MSVPVGIAIVVDESQLAELEKTVDRLGGTIKKSGQKGNLVFTEMTRQQQNADKAARLLTSTLGIQLPRGLDSILARTKLLAPALSAAFNATVVLAVVGAVIGLKDKIVEAAEALAGFNDTHKQMAERVIQRNREILLSFEDIGKGFKVFGDVTAQIDALQKRKGELEAAGGLSPALWLLNRGEINRITKQIESLSAFQEEISKRTQAIQQEQNKKRAAEAEKLAEEEAKKREKGVAILANIDRHRTEAMEAEQERINEHFRKIHENQLQNELKTAEDSGHIRQRAADERVDLLDQIAQHESDLEIMRREQAGDTVGVILEQERIRTERTIENLRLIGATEAEIARAREILNQQTNIRIADQQRRLAEEHRQMVNRLAEDMESWFDDIVGGRGLQRVLREFKKMVFQMIATWLGGLRQMQGAGAGGGGFSLGTLFGGIGLGGGAVPGGAAGGTGTPPFVNQFFGGMGFGLGNNLVSSGGGTAGVAAGQQQQGSLLGSLIQEGLGKIFPHGAGPISGAALGVGGILLGASSIISAFKSGSKLKGTLGGLAGGAMTGFAAFGPAGAVIGAGIGAIAGFLSGLFGSGRIKKKTNAAIENEYKPALKQIVDAYMVHQLEYQSAIQEIGQFSTQAQAELKQRFGNIGGQKFNSRLLPEITKARSDINAIEMERARRGALEFGPPQFHKGAVDIRHPAGRREFGAVLEAGESVINRQATARNRDVLQRINRGGSATASGPTIHIEKVEIRAMDDRGFERVLAENEREFTNFLRTRTMEGKHWPV